MPSAEYDENMRRIHAALDKIEKAAEDICKAVGTGPPRPKLTLVRQDQDGA